MQIDIIPINCLNHQYNVFQVALSLMDVEKNNYIANWQIKDASGSVLKGAIYEPPINVVLNKTPLEVLNDVADLLLIELNLQRA